MLVESRFRAVVPFLLVDGVLVLAMVMLLQLDWIVNHVLYDYGLVFSVNWAVPYWLVLRVCLVSLFLSVLFVSVFGCVAFRRAVRKRERVVFLCKSCGNGWVEVDKSVKIRGKLPRFRILFVCPSCDSALLDEDNPVVKGGELRVRERLARSVSNT